ncbi:MAG: DUF721 domain-containing protein, partial [Deltaproteobacteria bacterium]|nr:DUF721 domain-containing protein [Deltaproteobacteria bacterium]
MKPGTSQEPQSARAILLTLLKKRGLYTALSRHSVVTDWPKLVGPTLAAHARAEKVSGSTLFVIVDSSVWMHELAGLKRVLLDKVNGNLPEGAPPIDDIRFCQRSWASPSVGPPAEPSPPEPDSTDHATVIQLLEPVK